MMPQNNVVLTPRFLFSTSPIDLAHLAMTAPTFVTPAPPLRTRPRTHGRPYVQRVRASAEAPTRRASAVSDVLAAAMTGALSIGPLRRMLMVTGRQKIINDAKQIGVDWQGDVEALQALIPGELEPLRQRLDAQLDLPAYYCAQFHAYPRGNLGWLPALEAEVSSRTVHARHSNTAPLDGDATLRGNALRILAERWHSVHTAAPGAVLDIGTSVGLSAALLKREWPSARVVGVDASAEMLAVGALRRPDVEYMHALGERLPAEFASSFEVVTVQLVIHEMPDAPMRAVLREALRVLRPGGMLAVMDVDPSTIDAPAPFVVLFRSTEPFFDDHAARDVPGEIAAAGFTDLGVAPNTVNHRTYTAFKR